MVARNFEAPADTNTDNVYEVTIVATDVGNNRTIEIIPVELSIEKPAASAPPKV
jgi:hypothetical protein